MSLDIVASCATDWSMWDGTEAVTYYARRGGSIGSSAAYVESETIDLAKRRAPGWREKSASDATYQAAMLNWFIPAAKLADMMSGSSGSTATGETLEKPRPGDYIVDSDGLTWTVQTADNIVLKSIWKFQTLNLSIVYDLRDTISIERSAITYDSTGGIIRTWPPTGGSTPYDTISARVQLMTQDEVEQRSLRGRQSHYLVIVDQELTLTSEDRIKWVSGSTTNYLEIVDYHNAKRIDELPMVTALLQP